MTNDEIFESNLQHFKVSTRYGNKVQCFCPAHRDKQASLTVQQQSRLRLKHISIRLPHRYKLQSLLPFLV